MNGLVSTRWVQVVALVASVMLVWIAFVPGAFPWKVVLMVSLATSVAIWLSRTTPRSLTQVIRDVDAERSQVVSTPDRLAP
jgi:hypothetical protein